MSNKVYRQEKCEDNTEIVATHAVTGHQVALKLINRSKITTPDMNARVKREIQYLKVLRHPHIIKLYVLTALSVEFFVLACKSEQVDVHHAEEQCLSC